MATVPAGGGHPVDLRCGPVVPEALAWTTDGALAISAWGDGVQPFEARTVTVVDPATGEELAWLDGVTAVTWAADRHVRDDGARLVVTAFAEGVSVLVVRHADGTTTEVVRLEGPRDYDIASAQWSPDGAWVLAVDTRGRLFLVAADGDPGPRLVAETDGRDTLWVLPAWGSTGRRRSASTSPPSRRTSTHEPQDPPAAPAPGRAAGPVAPGPDATGMSAAPPPPAAAAPSSAWWERTAADVAGEVRVDLALGLSREEAARRLAEHGPNELVEQRGRPRWRMVLDQFANTMIVVLLVAAGVTATLGEYRDTVVILAIVVLNAAIGFVQEYRAEQAMEALQRLAAPTARVLRDGTVGEVPATELVPGDVMLLEAGDVVAADGRLHEAPNLRVNESALTGESVPVDKTSDPLARGAGDLVAERRNMVARGTAVVHGRGRAVVTATGMQTALGAIADMLQSHHPSPTPLQKRLAVLGQRLAVAALVVCLVVFVAGVARGEPVSLMFLTAVSLAVAAIPEALPAVVTLSLALGAQRMVHRHAIVRKLPAVETLGSVTVICTDKTGTLTEGSMVVERVWTPVDEYVVAGPADRPEGSIRCHGDEVDVADAPGLGELLRAAVLCNDAELAVPTVVGGPWTWTGDPTEAALLVLAERAGLDRGVLRRAHPRVAEVPFDADRKRMSTVHRRPGAGFVVAAKGAPEALLPLLRVDAAARTGAAAQADAYAEAGYRVLAIAGEGRDGRPDDPEDAEGDLVLLGLVAMADPPRPEAAAAVAACRTAGIRPVMITGDHPATGRAIADRIGILDDRRVMTGTELAEAGAGGLAERVGDVAVYARTTPRQKLDIVEAWKQRGDVVAMTGDGVNDAPALRRADIGVAMGIAGTEVSKEAAEMVLTDDDFATIVHAVEEGRRVYDNIRRFVRYTLTSNSGEIWVMFLAPFLGLPLPLLPVQILWINLVTDGLPGLALGVEPPERDVMQRPPRDPAESIFARGLWQHVLVVGLFMAAVPLALGLWAFGTDRPWQTMIFASLALLQLGHALAVRSERDSLFLLGLRTNLPLLVSVVGTVALQLAVVYWGPLQTMFRTEALATADLLVVLVASTAVFWAVELEKWVRRRSAPPTASVARLD